LPIEVLLGPGSAAGDELAIVVAGPGQKLPANDGALDHLEKGWLHLELVVKVRGDQHRPLRYFIDFSFFFYFFLSVSLSIHSLFFYNHSHLKATFSSSAWLSTICIWSLTYSSAKTTSKKKCEKTVPRKRKTYLAFCFRFVLLPPPPGLCLLESHLTPKKIFA
jgi:hypothetical protein